MIEPTNSIYTLADQFRKTTITFRLRKHLELNSERLRPTLHACLSRCIGVSSHPASYSGATIRQVDLCTLLIQMRKANLKWMERFGRGNTMTSAQHFGAARRNMRRYNPTAYSWTRFGKISMIPMTLFGGCGTMITITRNKFKKELRRMTSRQATSGTHVRCTCSFDVCNRCVLRWNRLIQVGNLWVYCCCESTIVLVVDAWAPMQRCRGNSLSWGRSSGLSWRSLM